MRKKFATVFAAAMLAVSMLTGCANTGASSSAEATKEKPLVLTLAHSLAEGHITSVALQEFADNVEAKSDGRIQVRIFPNATLGSETEVLEQLMAGVVDMTRVGAPGLATYNEGYHTFGLPYVFADDEHYYKAMGSEVMDEFFRSSADDGFITLTYYTSGSRSFYTKDRPIRTPEDLAGLKIRVQDMKSQTDMMKALGGVPVAMPVGDVYTALQTGILDGAESNETVLTTGMHGEVCKFFSVDQHSVSEDVMVIATNTWNSLSAEDQQILVDAAKESTKNHIEAWNAVIEEAKESAINDLGVTFVEDVDKEAFRSATAGMIQEYRDEYPKVGEVLDIINSVK